MIGKIKKTIIALLLVLMALIIIVVVSAIILNKKVDNNFLDGEDEERRKFFDTLQNNPTELINGEKLAEIKSESVYFSINGIIDKYITYLEENNSIAVYNVLYKEYINNNNLKEQNVLLSLNKCNNYNIDKMYGIGISNYAIYYVKISNGQLTENLLVNWDKENKTFSICPISEENYKMGIEQGIEVTPERVEAIEKNEFNQVISTNLDKDTISAKYFYNYIDKILYNTKEAYEILDERYKNINFTTYEDFKEYIENNKQKFENLTRSNFKSIEDFENEQEYEQYKEEKFGYKIEKYTKKYTSSETIYTFEDSYGKYYTFKVTAAMKYTVILDNYTLPADDFLETYNKSSDPQKVVLNVKKFFMGIDDKNYGYSYSLLSDSFKTNKYPTKGDFVKYVKENFFEENNVEYVSYEEKNGLYIYKINITDATGKEEGKKSFNMIVKLNTGTDFEMSFGTD